MSDGLRAPLHGRDHRPGGIDPSRSGPWHNVGDPNEPPIQNGSNMTPTADIPNPVALRFSLLIGPPNEMNGDGTIRTYTDHRMEIQGDVTGLSAGDVVFTLPAAYRFDHDIPVAGHDDDGNYVPCRLFSNGDYVYGVP